MDETVIDGNFSAIALTENGKVYGYEFFFGEENASGITINGDDPEEVADKARPYLLDLLYKAKEQAEN